MAEKNSGLGNASFIISIVAGVLMFLLFIVAGVIEETTPGGIDEESDAAMMIGCSLFIFLFADVVALGLGIGGVCKKNYKKLLAVLGICFSSGTILVIFLLMLIGLVVA